MLEISKSCISYQSKHIISIKAPAGATNHHTHFHQYHQNLILEYALKCHIRRPKKSPPFGWMLNAFFKQCFSCPKQLNRWPCHSLTDWLTDWLTDSTFCFWHTKSNPGELWPLRHLIRVVRRHDLNEKIPTYLLTCLPTNLPTSLTEHPHKEQS